MTAFEQAVITLKNNGYKTTGKRQKILELLYNQDKYMTAKEVQNSLKPLFPGISPDTIYRNLNTFVDLSVVEETELNGEKLFRFSCELHGHHHHHFICTECGKTIGLEDCPIDMFSSQLPGCQVTAHRFELFGLCETCSIAS
ncbi:Fur family transcriptional regulator [Marinilactibacillus piezotolerans]|uniref:Fur family transcriptional regulator n=1 Tax=Marinilactibacillus piezotolerans TaxID=258723 RepID=UPI0009AF989D|nr:Fur family transcriptional regulator [Marinilactibacillus piezotolerans]